MEVLSFVRSSLLSATFDMLLEKLKRYLSDQPQNSNEEVHAQMESWKTLLPKITTLLQHAEENQVANQFVKSYLDDLKDLAYDMEDILEEFVIEAKRCEFEAKSSKLQKINPRVFFKSKARPSQEINSMVNDLSGRLQKIDNGMHSLGMINLALKLEGEPHNVVAKRLPESSLLEEKVMGRDSDKDAILQRLLQDEGNLEQDFVIPIVGMGGLGKTTLARLIYNDTKLEETFNLKAWVCVSNEFDVARITRTILEHVTRERCDFDFGLLQEKLKEELSGRKFLLVLDDVWNKEYGQWDVLKRPFMSGAPGSKIIVTTRNKDVGTMMRGDDRVYNLELLQDNACLPLFIQHALGKENFNVPQDLQDVGEKLVKRCKRLPLAIKTLSGILRGKLHLDEWENILNSEIWSALEDGSGILPTLRLSYNHLPSHLKRCFAYCALFPKNYEFDKKELVLLWMAEGLLQQQSHGKRQMPEEIGDQYFQDLLSRSLFQQSSGDEVRFVMHDLINDLAADVAGEIYCNLGGNMGDEKLEKAHHLSFTPHDYEISERFTVLNKLKHLRTFLPLGESYKRYYLSNRILHDFLPTLNRLRVLSLCGYRISKLPSFFESLTHIRYINLSYTNIKCLSESVGSLLFLQTLLLSGCRFLNKLPTTIGNLIDLHYLDINETPSLKEMPSNICYLKNLVTLSKVIVGKASELMSLSDLKNFSQLRGKLSLLDLQNVSNVQDAGKANLDKIHGLEELLLKWTSSDSDRNELVLEMEVLHGLKPHSNLKSLEIFCYGGENFPNWVCDPLLFFNLSSMVLSSCKRCTFLPSLGLLPALKELIVEGMEAIEAIGSEFYGGHDDSFLSLEVLVFQNMLKWKTWTFPVGSEGEFNCLRRLVIENCPNLLGQLPNNLSSLKELDVRNCKKISELTCLPISMSLPSLKELYIENCNGVLLKSMVNLTSLANLRIEKISELTCLSMSMSLPSLKELYIENCNGALLKSMVDLTSLTNLRMQDIGELTCLPKSFTQSLIALETLYIALCNDLTCLWEEGTEIEHSRLPLNLKHLSLVRCGALESLPDAMMVQMDGSSSGNASMLRLEKLEISNCDSLKSFPRGKLPNTLTYLKIEGCKGVESLSNGVVDNNSNLHLEISRVPCWYSSEGCHQLPTFLKKFGVSNCQWLESFPEKMLQHCMGLQSIDIYNCKILKSLPTLDCVSSLKNLRIQWCENFKSFPNKMCNLKSLQRLEINDCPGIKCIPYGGLPPNLKDLQLKRCKNLKHVPTTMHQLTSLQILKIPGGALKMGFGQSLESLTSLQDLAIEQTLPLDIVLPSSLTSLEIRNEGNLESIPRRFFQNLNSLKDLEIVLCPKLQSLPREGFPPSLRQITIMMCPLLKRQRFEKKGDYCTLTRNIPYIWTDGVQVDY